MNAETQQFYDSARWKRVAAKRMRMDGYKCQICKRYGRMVEATQVHHIEHLEDAPDRALDITNLISLCRRCHNAQHPEKAAAMNNSKTRREY